MTFVGHNSLYGQPMKYSRTQFRAKQEFGVTQIYGITVKFPAKPCDGLATSANIHRAIGRL